MGPRRKRSSSEAIESSLSKRKSTDSRFSQLNTLPPYVRCGKILRMHLTNFMCHSNLTINFNERINFLIGSNGSGKSAILAALVLVFGSRATATNRSPSLKHFIKTDEASANIEVEISNAGPDAYTPEIFGDKIIVLRHIASTGSYYRIKNSSGVLVSKKVDDLHKILLYHNIQVDNPVFVLNQDTARVFLKDLDPHKNYELFTKATQIDLIKDKLNDCLQSAKEQASRLHCLEEKTSLIQREIDEAKQKLAQLESLKELKNLLASSKIERTWVAVIHQEKSIQNIETQIKNLTDERNKLEEMIQNKTTIEEDYNRLIRELNSSIQAKMISYQEENTRLQELKTESVMLGDKCNEIDCNHKVLNKRRVQVEEQIKKVEKYISEKTSSHISVQELRANHQQKIKLLKEKQQQATTRIGTTKQDILSLINNKNNIDQKINDLKKKQHQMQEESRRIQSQIQNIKANSKDAISIYGEQVRQIVGIIGKFHAEGKFTELPRGPLGRYVEVVDAKYRDSVETLLGRLVKSFVVNCNEDFKTMRRILKNYPNINFPIITSRYGRKAHDVSRFKVQPPPNTHVLIDLIRCSDHIVLNCLIDQCSIETILLTESKKTAELYTSDIANVPRNLSKIILVNPGIEYCPEPSYRMYSLKIRPAQYIQVNIQERIQQLLEEREKRDHEVQQAESTLAEIRPHLQNLQKEIEQKRDISESCEQINREIQANIYKLENYEYPRENELDLLNNELEECKKMQLQIEQQIQEKEKELSDAKIAHNIMEHELTEKKLMLKEIESDMDQMKSQVENVKAKQRSFLSSICEKTEKREELCSTITAQENTKSVQMRILSDLTSQAEKQGPRIDSQRSETEIDDVIRQLQSKIKHGTQSNDNPADVQELIKRKMESYCQYKELCLAARDSLQMLGASCKKRFMFINNLKRFMAMRVTYIFQSILAERNFSGNASVDHEGRKLTISVVPRNNNVQVSMSGTDSLSGGERSFSTVAFLLSLWSCVDHPFYFLDEYDVFTDEVNRDLITRLLINEAEEKAHRQYTFLTPQDMAIKSTESIRIHRMADPKR